MLYECFDDILNVKHGIICHQVNCKGKMGAGLALDIRKKWPIVYENYMNAFKEGKLFLGNVIISTIVYSRLYVGNICGQYYYGRKGKYTVYTAIRSGLKYINKISWNKGLTVYIPKNMGCGLAGGDWSIVYKIIEEEIPNAIIVRKDMK